MRVSKELDLTTFDFWAGAKDHKFTYDELKELEYVFDDLFPEGATETNINDMFWFEEEYIAEMIGVDFEDDYLER